MVVPLFFHVAFGDYLDAESRLFRGPHVRLIPDPRKWSTIVYYW